MPKLDREKLFKYLESNHSEKLDLFCLLRECEVEEETIDLVRKLPLTHEIK
jgi:hypothetical protein